MMIQFSLESVEYLAEKVNQCYSLSDEALAYLATRISELISNLLQDANKFRNKCRRNDLIGEDFAFALKLHHLQPTYGSYTMTNDHPVVFRKLKKESRFLYHIEDKIVPVENLITYQAKIPLDISIRTHWLALNGKQPKINENPTIHTPRQTISGNKFDKIPHILSMEQQIYYKELTEMCVGVDKLKRKQALVILSSDSSLQQIIARLIFFISEGVRVNLTIRSTYLMFLMQMVDALLHNESLSLEPYLHYLLPAIFSCLLTSRISYEHWPLRDLAARCSVQIVQKYATAANGLQQRVINLFYRILTDPSTTYPWSTHYGALIGLCQMNDKVIIQIVFPLIKKYGEEIPMISDAETSKKITEVLLKFLTIAYRSLDNDKTTGKNLMDIFGPYFTPLIQQQLILLL